MTEPTIPSAPRSEPSEPPEPAGPPSEPAGPPPEPPGATGETPGHPSESAPEPTRGVSAPPPAVAAPRRLARSRSDRMVAGVCGGLGAYFDVDPVVFRVVLAVLAVFGGTGLLLYAAAWLLMPEEGRPGPILQLRRGDTVSVLAVVVVAILAVATIGALGDRRGPGFLLLPLLVIAAVVLLARRRPAAGAAGGPSAAESAYYGAPETLQQGEPGLPSGSSPTYDAGTRYADYPPAPPPRRERSPLGMLTLGVALLAAGTLLALDTAGWIDVSVAVVLAVTLAVVGAGLVVGGWWGRSRALIAAGVVLTIALAGAASARTVALQHGAGERLWAPRSLAELAPAYRLGVGDARLDLAAVGLAGPPRRVEARVGIGELLVIVPDDAAVRVTARSGTGEVSLFGQVSSGTSVERAVSLPGRPGAGELVLDLGVGMGRVEVRRATA